MPTAPINIRQEIERFMPHLRLLSIPSDTFIDHIVPSQIFTPEECTNILMRMRGMSTPLLKSVTCSPIPYSRVNLSNETLKYVVLTRVTDNRKNYPTAISELTLIKNLTVSTSILLHQLETQDNATLKHAQMIISDSEGRQVGVAKALGSKWRFTVPAFLHAGKPYTVTIDRVMVSKVFVKKEFCTYCTDVKFRGCTGDNFIKLAFWPTQIKS